MRKRKAGNPSSAAKLARPTASLPCVQDQDHRDRARLTLGSNVVVEAGAGTGKTTILTERLLFLLLAGGPGGKGLELSRVVALTFTEKAAGELKLRLSSRLSDILLDHEGRLEDPGRRTLARGWIEEAQRVFVAGPERIAAMVRGAIADLDRAAIGTIHQFAARLLRLFPIEAGVDPGFVVDEGDAFEEMFGTEWALWLDRELAADAPRREAWLEVLNLVRLEDLAGLARALCQDGVRQGSVGTTKEMAERVAQTAREVGVLRDHPDPGRSKIKAVIDVVSHELERLCAVLGSPSGGKPSAGSSATESRLPEEPRGRAIGNSDWPNAWSGLGGRERYRDGAALARAVSAESELLVRRAASLVLPFADAFREKYARRGWIGFDGLLTRCRDLLRNDQGARAEIKARFDALLIDEFQDTDPLQGEIILYTGEEKGSFARDWRDLKLAPGRLFIVGDPKQSIYRFRGADIRAYAHFTGLLLEQGALKCDLQTSFRSPKGILQPVNAVFSRVMTETEGLQPAYLPVFPRPAAAPLGAAAHPVPGEKAAASSPTRPIPESWTGRSLPASWRGTHLGVRGDAGVSFALVHDPKAPGRKLKAWERQRAEAAWIASWISRHVDGKTCRPRDIAILMRTTSALGSYIEALKDAGVPYVVESDRFFYSTQEIVDFLNFLRVIDDPGDRVSFVGVLRSPLGCQDDPTIQGLAAANAWSYEEDPPEGLPPAAAARLQALYSRMRGLRRFAGREPLGAFMARVLSESFVLEVGASSYHSEQTVSNLMKFGRLAAEAGRKGSTLKDFIAEATRAMKEATDEGESPLGEASFDAVRLMTMHKAKGLEFPVVIIPNLTGKRGGSAEKPAALVDWSQGTAGLRLVKAGAADAAMALIEAQELRREEHEACRLLYVAMTRAKERLLLVGDARAGEKSSLSSWLERAGAWPAGLPTSSDGSGLPERKGPPAGRQSGIFLAGPPDGGFPLPVELIDVACDVPGRKIRREREPRGDWEELARSAAERRAERDRIEGRPLFTSPSAQLAEPEKGAFPPEEGGAFSQHAALLGRVCHQVLEDWDFKGTPGVEAAVGRLSWQHPEADWRRVSKEAREILGRFASSPECRELQEAEIIGREVPFVCPRDGQVLRGSIDLLYRDRSGALWVADYKTERSSPGAARRYEAQGRAYVEAVTKAMGETPRFRLIFLRRPSS